MKSGARIRLRSRFPKWGNGAPSWRRGWENAHEVASVDLLSSIYRGFSRGFAVCSEREMDAIGSVDVARGTDGGRVNRCLAGARTRCEELRSGRAACSNRSYSILDDRR